MRWQKFNRKYSQAFSNLQLYYIQTAKNVVEWLLNQTKVDYAFNYKKLGAGSEDNSNNSISSELKDAFPNGIDLYFDNVGGRHLEAARLFKVYRTTTAIYYNSQRVEVS